MFLTDYDEQSHMAMERDEWTEKGQNIKLITQVRKKLVKSLAPAEIADIFEEDTALIEKICGLIQDQPDLTDIQICDLLD